MNKATPTAEFVCPISCSCGDALVYSICVCNFSGREYPETPGNDLDTFELHATLLTPNLARYSRIHACELCKRSDFTTFRPKKGVLYSCLHSSTRVTKIQYL